MLGLSHKSMALTVKQSKLKEKHVKYKALRLDDEEWVTLIF